MAETSWGTVRGAASEQPGAALDDSLLPHWEFSRTATTVSFDGFTAEFPPPTNRVYGQVNDAVRFASGDLLFNVLPDNICYHFSQRTKKFTFVFELHWGPGALLWSVCPDRNGNIFATISGMRTAPPITDVRLGNWGAIVAVNPRKRAMRTLAERGQVVDPYSLQVLPDGRLLTADFSGFRGEGSAGRVYFVDPFCGDIEVVAEGANMVDPTSAFIDAQGQLWVANGDQDQQDGEVLCFDLATGGSRVVFPRQGRMTGALLGVYPSHDEEFLLATKNEWSNRTRSCVMLIDKSSGVGEKILTADDDNPRFYSTIGCTVGSTLWIAECVNRELIEYDLVERAIRATYDLSPIMRGHRGMRNSFDAVSAFYAVP